MECICSYVKIVYKCIYCIFNKFDDKFKGNVYCVLLWRNV